MGMFDSFYDTDGNEWQTKALACLLDRYYAGDTVPGPPFTYQIAVYGGPDDGPWAESFATIRDGALARVPDDRDWNLPLLDYHGGWPPAWNGAPYGHQ